MGPRVSLLGLPSLSLSLDTVPHFPRIIIRQRGLRVSGERGSQLLFLDRWNRQCQTPLQQVQTHSTGAGGDQGQDPQYLLALSRHPSAPPRAGSCPFSTNRSSSPGSPRQTAAFTASFLGLGLWAEDWDGLSRHLSPALTVTSPRSSVWGFFPTHWADEETGKKESSQPLQQAAGWLLSFSPAASQPGQGHSRHLASPCPVLERERSAGDTPMTMDAAPASGKCLLEEERES